MDLERFWGKVCKDAKGVSRPCLAHDAFLAWITSVLSGGNFNSRHKALVNEAYASDKEEFIWCMDYAFGATRSQKLQDLLEEKDPCAVVEMTKELRRSIFRKHLGESPVKTLKRSFKHWYVELKHHLFPKLPTIAFLGPDGSGKSSVISGLKKELREMRLNCRSLHWRPYGIKGREDLGVAVADPHAAEPRGLITSVLKLGMLFYDWWLASLTVLLHARAKISVVICDRYYNDLLVDTRRYRYGGPKWLAKLVFKFMPRPNLVFILVGTPEIIHPRKQEVRLDELRRQIEAYKELAEFIGESAMLVNVDEALDTVIEKVCTRQYPKVAHFMPHYPSMEGSSAYCRGLSKAMNEIQPGCCPIISIRRNLGELQYGEDVIHYPVTSKNPMSIPKKLVEALEDNRHELDGIVLHCTYNARAATLHKHLRRLKIPYIFMPHDPYVEELMSHHAYRKWIFWHLYEKQMIKHAMRVQLLSADHEEPLKLTGCNTEVEVIPNGCEVETLAELPRMLRIPGDNPRVKIQFLGRMDRNHKGLDILIEGFAQFLKEDLSAGVDLYLTGKDWEDRDFLERLTIL